MDRKVCPTATTSSLLLSSQSCINHGTAPGWDLLEPLDIPNVDISPARAVLTMARPQAQTFYEPLDIPNATGEFHALILFNLLQ